MLVEFLINLFLSVPQLPIMIVIGAFFGQSSFNIICIIAAFSWAPIAKQVRARTMSLRRTRYPHPGQKLRRRTVVPVQNSHESGYHAAAGYQLYSGDRACNSPGIIFGLPGPVRPSGEILGTDDSPLHRFKGIYFTEFLEVVAAAAGFLSLVISVLLLRCSPEPGELLAGEGVRDMSILLEVKELSLSYPEFSLHPLSFSLDSGEILAVVGESGSGKTTLLKGLSCLWEEGVKVSGQVLLEGRELLGMKEEQRRQLAYEGIFRSLPKLHGLAQSQHDVERAAEGGIAPVDIPPGSCRDV